MMKNKRKLVILREKYLKREGQKYEYKKTL